MEPIEVKRILTYSSVFGDNEESLNDLLEKLPTESSVQLASYLLIQKSTLKINEDEHRLFYQMFPFMDSELSIALCNYINNQNSNLFEFIDKVALHILIDKLLAHQNKWKCKVSDNPHLFSTFIKAYLMCCDIHLNSIGDNIPTGLSEDDFIKIFICETLKYHDLDYFKDYRYEMMKLCYFFDFMQTSDQYKSWLNLFLKARGIIRWDHYPLFLIQHFMPLILHEKGATCTFSLESTDYYAYSLIESMVVSDSSYSESKDLNGLRSFPLYKIDECTFIVMSINFFIDKFFQSFIFDFAKVLSAHNTLTGIRGYNQLKAWIGSEFIEREFFYKILKGCFPHYKISTGSELHNVLGSGEPDAMIRKGSKIFIFEFKDILLDATTKHCGDFEKIFSELKEQFVLSTKDKQTGKLKKKPRDKGIRQLLNVISEKLPGIIQNVTSTSGFTIYPVIVYTDRSFGIEGINNFLNCEFSDQKKSYEISPEFTIKPLVLVPLEELTMLEDYFKSNRLLLPELVEMYYKEDSMLSFQKFMMREAIKKGYHHEMTDRFRRLYNSLKKDQLSFE
ncbi:MAG: hypothetical protein K2K75_03900 [Muribaculaceae bacterium]|nr:hypothetical protein [Muribaculaceae bacterium]